MVRSAAAITAFEVRPQKSAPVKFLGIFSKIGSQSKSYQRVRWRVCALKILILSSLARVMPRQICLSNLPGRKIEGSNKSGRLVAPIMKTWLADAESICCSSSATIRSITWLESPLFPLLGTRASSSSMKIIQGLHDRALSNTSLTFFSLSPTYMFSSSGPFTLMKLILHSLATHLPRRVFPVPGGPQKSKPVLGLIHQSNISGCLMGSSTVWMIYYLAVYRPPTSSQLTSIRFYACYCFTNSLSFFITYPFQRVRMLGQEEEKKLRKISQPNLS